MLPYDPDSRFDGTYSFPKLEEAGMPIIEHLSNLKLEDLASVIGITEWNADLGVEQLIEDWESAVSNCRPPSWRSLFEILTELGLEDLSKQIHNYVGE